MADQREKPILFSGPMVRAILDDAEVAAMFNDGMTAAEIAVVCGCSTFPVKKALRRLGLRRPAKRRPWRGFGHDNPSWKGGRRQRRDGYILLRVDGTERLEHRVVMERVLGRALRPDEIVHHIDGDKSNNSPGNLEVMTQSQHAKLHAPMMHTMRWDNG